MPDMIFNTLIPELSVTDFQESFDFYTLILGFSVAYMREEDGFAFLTLGDAQIMIDQVGKGRTWKTARFGYPLGRGINLQIEVNCIEPLLTNLKLAGVGLFLEVEEKWYRQDDHEVGNKQFLVQDPDGYLLRFVVDLGSRPLGKSLLPDELEELLANSSDYEKVLGKISAETLVFLSKAENHTKLSKLLLKNFQKNNSKEATVEKTNDLAIEIQALARIRVAEINESEDNS